MKKFLTWTFWLALLGSFVYFYMTNAQMKEYCTIIKKRIMDLLNQMSCCKNDVYEESEENVE